MNRNDRMRLSISPLDVLAGLSVSLGFVIGAWSLDWAENSAAAVPWPWLHFTIGAVVCLPIGLIASLAAKRSQSRTAAILVWAAAAAGMAVTASHVPYGISSWLIGWVGLPFTGVDAYSYTPGGSEQQWIVVGICVLLGVVCGGLSRTALDNLYRKSGFLGKSSLLFVCSLMFTLGGLVLDLATIRPSRTISLENWADNFGEAEGPNSEMPAQTPDWAQTLIDPSLPATLIDLPVYDLSLEIQPDGMAYNGEVILVYTNKTGTELDELVFRLLPNAGVIFGTGSLEASGVKVNGTPVDPVPNADPSILRIPLPVTLLKGQTVTVRMNFSGQVPRDFAGEEQGAYGIFNFTQQVLSLSSWYPILAVFENGAWRTDAITPIGDAVYSEMAVYTLEVTTPSHWEVAATGVAVSEHIINENGAVRRNYLSGPVRDFYLVASPDFSRLTTEAGGVTINAYGLPGFEEGNATALEVTTQSLEIFNEQFGNYPYTELDVVQIPLRNASGVEFPGIFLIKSDLYAHPDDVSFITTLAHEVAHQWWYNVVGNDVFNEPWLDEALATYTSGVYWEFQGGQQAYQGIRSYWQGRVQDLRDAGKDDRVSGTLTHFMETDPLRYGPIVYSKGALFFDALRAEVGDQAFFEALRAYYREYQFKIAHGQDLLNRFEATSGENLDELYTEWLYQP